MAAPFVLEYDPAGKFTEQLGRPELDLHVAAGDRRHRRRRKGNVWIAAAGRDAPRARRGRGAARAAARRPLAAGRGARPGRVGRGAPRHLRRRLPPADAHVLKFARDGRHLLTIGTPGKMDGADSQTTLNRPSGDGVRRGGQRNLRRRQRQPPHRRVRCRHAAPTSVTGSRTARRRRARRPVRTTRASRPPSRSATSTCVEIARDGMVYVCDKSSNRIQVFDKSGKFIKEGIVAKTTMGGVVAGSFGVAQRRGLGVGRRVLERSAAALPVRGRRPEQEGPRPAARHAGRGRHDSAAAAGTRGSSSRSAASPPMRRATCTPVKTHHGKRVQKFTLPERELVDAIEACMGCRRDGMTT